MLEETTKVEISRSNKYNKVTSHTAFLRERDCYLQSKDKLTETKKGELYGISAMY